MADLTVTVDSVRPLDISQLHTISTKAGEALTRGQPVYDDTTTGRAKVGRANAVGTAKITGIAMNDAALGRPVTTLHYGRFDGFDLSSVAPGTTIYLSVSTGGKLADAAATGTGNVVVPIGTVKVAPDQAGTKYLFVDIRQSNATPTAL